MKTTMKFLASGLLAGALTFVGCKSDTSAERPADTTQTTPATGDQGTGTEGTGTGTEAPPGTGGSGDISKTKQSDDNLRMPYEDPLRTPERESIRDAESEAEPEVHEPAGIGGSGFGDEEDNSVDETLNPGGNVDETLRIPDSPADVVPEDSMSIDSQLPEDAR